jgi:hypothetical protein
MRQSLTLVLIYSLLRPIDLDLLQEAVAKALPTVHMGEMEPIKHLPGVPAAVVGTFDKVWRAGVDIAAIVAAIDHPRTAVLAALEDEVVRRLPASMKRPAELDRAGRQMPPEGPRRALRAVCPVETGDGRPGRRREAVQVRAPRRRLQRGPDRRELSGLVDLVEFLGESRLSLDYPDSATLVAAIDFPRHDSCFTENSQEAAGTAPAGKQQPPRLD